MSRSKPFFLTEVKIRGRFVTQLRDIKGVVRFQAYERKDREKLANKYYSSRNIENIKKVRAKEALRQLHTKEKTALQKQGFKYQVSTYQAFKHKKTKRVKIKRIEILSKKKLTKQDFAIVREKVKVSPKKDLLLLLYDPDKKRVKVVGQKRYQKVHNFKYRRDIDFPEPEPYPKES